MGFGAVNRRATHLSLSLSHLSISQTATDILLATETSSMTENKFNQRKTSSRRILVTWKELSPFENTLSGTAP